MKFKEGKKTVIACVATDIQEKDIFSCYGNFPTNEIGKKFFFPLKYFPTSLTKACGIKVE